MFEILENLFIWIISSVVLLSPLILSVLTILAVISGNTSLAVLGGLALLTLGWVTTY